MGNCLATQEKHTSCKSMTYRMCSVPRAGIEPARLAALVFETNASTNSAIWAHGRGLFSG